jgi:hypothetical protein
VSEFLATLDRTLVALAAADPDLRRFGAARHGYRRAPVVAPPDAPEDLRDYAGHFAGGGVGPYYGLVRLDRVQPIAAPAGVTAWTRALPIAHLGCGYAAVVALDGPRGEVWIDARAVGVVAPIYPSFTAYYLDWIDHLAHNRWPRGFVPAGACAIAVALSGYLGVHEQRLGIAPGTLAGADLAAALAALGPGAIEVTAEASVLFDPADPVDPCVTCARLVDNLGLPPAVVSPGAIPRPDR